MTNEQKTALQQRAYQLDRRIAALNAVPDNSAINEVIAEYRSELKKITKACSQKYAFIYNFKSGGWNTSVGYTLEEAILNAKQEFPGTDIDEKSFRLSTLAEERQLLAMCD